MKPHFPGRRDFARGFGNLGTLERVLSAHLHIPVKAGLWQTTATSVGPLIRADPDPSALHCE